MKTSWVLISLATVIFLFLLSQKSGDTGIPYSSAKRKTYSPRPAAAAPGAPSTPRAEAPVVTCAVPLPLPRLTAPSPSLPAALHAYAAFHALGRQCLVRPRSAVRSTPLTRRCEAAFGEGGHPRVLVWNCPRDTHCHGVGDRMRGVGTALLVAIITRRVFFLEWPMSVIAPFPLEAVMQPAAVDWRVPGAGDGAWNASRDGNETKVHFWKDEVTYRLRMEGKSLETIDATAFNFTKAFLPFHTVYFRSMPRRKTFTALWENDGASALREEMAPLLSAGDIHRALLKLLFTPAPIVEDMAARRSFPAGTPYVAMHARLGHDFKEVNQRFDKVESDSLSRFAKRFLSTAINLTSSIAPSADRQPLNIFLASDSLPLKEAVKLLARNRSDLTLRTHMAGAVHVGRETLYAFMGDAHDQCLAFVDVFADLIAMGRARALVFLPSGFPLTAVALGRTSMWCSVDYDSVQIYTSCTHSVTPKPL